MCHGIVAGVVLDGRQTEMAEGQFVRLGQLIQNGGRSHRSSCGFGQTRGTPRWAGGKGFRNARSTVGVDTRQDDGVLVGRKTERTGQGTTHVGEFTLESVPEVSQLFHVVVVVFVVVVIFFLLLGDCNSAALFGFLVALLVHGQVNLVNNLYEECFVAVVAEIKEGYCGSVDE